MERIVAIKKLRKLLGKSLGYCIDQKAPTAEERDEAKLALPAAYEARDRLRKQLDERYNAILAADQEYQSLKVAHKAAKEHADKLNYKAHHQFKFKVGTSNGIFFHVKAEGDSWEEVIAKLKPKQ